MLQNHSVKQPEGYKPLISELFLQSEFWFLDFLKNFALDCWEWKYSPIYIYTGVHTAVDCFIVVIFTWWVFIKTLMKSLWFCMFLSRSNLNSLIKKSVSLCLLYCITHVCYQFLVCFQVKWIIGGGLVYQKSYQNCFLGYTSFLFITIDL